jgi:hypothetical protein
VLPDIGRHAGLLHLLLQRRDVIIVVVLTELALICKHPLHDELVLDLPNTCGGSHRWWGEDNSVKGVVDRSLDLKHASMGEVITKPQP